MTSRRELERTVATLGPCIAAALSCGCGVPDVTFAPGDASIADALLVPDTDAPNDTGGGPNDAADAAPADAATGLDATHEPDAAGSRDASDAGNSLAACQMACEDAGIGTCDSQGVCVVTCSGATACGTGIACPPGIPCSVVCAGTSACGGNVDCSQASTCDVQCTGTNACTGSITCGGTMCSIECSNTSACRGHTTCDAGTCQVSCSGTGSCGGLVTCSGGTTCSVNCGGVGACSGGVCCQDPSCSLTSVANGC